MYSASADFLTKIKSNTRHMKWSGTITTVGGVTYAFDADKDSANGKIVSGSITRSISSQSLNVGTAYASTLSLEVVLPAVSRYELYNGEVSLSFSIDGAADVIPMGIFTISEANQALDHITIKAYDNMTKFDAVSFSASLNNSIQSPYVWLSQACVACGVTLGTTSAQIEAMPNGRRKTGFADSVADAKTWRDVLSYITAYLGGYAYIGRDGYLYIGSYSSNSADTVHSNFRYTSDLSDFRTTYDGLYATYKNEGVQEYVSNSNTGGLVLDLGTNPFLQFTNQTNRLEALQEIIDAWDGVYYVPYSSDMPLIPIYDVGDVLTFVDNQADVYDLGAITEITYKIDGTMSVKCAGDNPLLADAQDRFTKTLEGISSEYSNGQEIGDKDFWLLYNTNTEPINIDSTETLVTEIEFEQKTFAQKIEMILTADMVLSATATVNVRLIVDDETDLEMNVTEEKSFKGERVFHCSNPQTIFGEGLHSAKVYMTVTDNPTLWSDLV
jgi:hypothetical protein